MILPHRRSNGHPLTHSELGAFHAALRHSRKYYLDVRILDRNENQISSLTAPGSLVVGGQVDVDTSRAVTRSISIDVIDPTHRLYLDPDSPHKGALYPGQSLRVLRWEWVEELTDWIMVPVFWGPISLFTRKGHEVTIEGQGKESLYLEPGLLWEPLTFRKGFPTVTALHDVLYRRGERRFALPHMNNRLPNKLSLTRHDEPWKVAKALAHSLNRQLYVTGDGIVKVRSTPSSAVLPMYATTIPGKPESVVLTEPELKVDFFADMRNTQEVLGPQPVGKQKRIRAVELPPAGDPLSPSSLAIHGAPRYLVYSEENDTIKRQSFARLRAQYLSRHNALLTVDAQFTCLPHPHLEELDVIALIMEDTTILLQMQKFSIPLTADGVMTVGSNKRTSLHRRRA